jgi:hypothetical protein
MSTISQLAAVVAMLLALAPVRAAAGKPGRDEGVC